MERASIDNGGSNDMMSRVHNNNSSTNLTNNAWDNTIISTTTIPTTTSTLAYGGTPYYDYTNQILFNNSTTFDNNHCMRDPHMMCLRLGKRHYCSDTVVAIPDRYVTAESSSAANKRSGKQPYPYAMTARCQVDGCHVALFNVKEYYRRHKVCEIHSKAPKVVVLGLQQRFCQQCSRFHVMSEFDEAKRSCRRRLEGHNQRRRKGSIANTLPRNFPHYHENHPMLAQQLRALPRLASPPHSKPGSALSLLSSPNLEPWMISSGDLSSRCSAALYELIAANRATNVVGGNFLNQNTSHQAVIENTIETLPGTQMWVDSMTHITRPWHLT